MHITLIEPLGISETLLQSYIEPIRELGHTFDYYQECAQNTETLIERTQDADIIMLANQPLPDDVITSARHLQYINIAFTGFDHVNIDLATSQGILVSNAAGYSTTAVSELVLGLALSSYRMLNQSDVMTRQGKGLADYYQGFEIKGKTVGIIGTGKIGKATAKLFLAFGAKVIAHSRHQDVDLVALGIEYVSLETLLKTADIISLHLALNQDTFHYLDGEKLALLKPSALLINCARGPIIDNQALADLLNQDKIGFAAIDVFDQEPPLGSDDPLLHAKNTILTPHIAFSTQEAMVKRAAIVFDNLHSFLDGCPKNIINP